MDSVTIRCWDPMQAHRAITRQVWPALKAALMAGQRMVIKVEQEKRSLAENAKLHALLTQISRQVEWAGAKRDVETWKRLTTAAWLRARGEHVEMLPALDGHGVDIVFRRTSQLTRAECAELIDFVQAWAAEHGVSTGRVDPETGDLNAALNLKRLATETAIPVASPTSNGSAASGIVPGVVGEVTPVRHECGREDGSGQEENRAHLCALSR